MGHGVDALGSTYRDHRSDLGAVLARLAQSSRSATLQRQRRVVDRATSARYDVVIALEGTLLPEAVDRIRRNGSAVAVWFAAPVTSLGRQLPFLADYDVVCLNDSLLVDRCRTVLAAKVIHLPEACNPSWHRPCDAESEPIVVVAGSMYPFRLRLLEKLPGVGIPVRIYGPRWPSWLESEHLRPAYTGKYLAREEKARAFRSAGLVLNILHPAEMAGLNGSLFEAAGCGAAVLTDVRPDLDGMFDIGREVASFDSFDDLVDRARWMLDHPDDVRAMGDRAAARSHADHTYDNRLGTLLAALS
jgi:spore maturation protein CgeB